METGTALTILGTAIGSAKTIERILGPTADYLGDGLKDFTKKRVENIANILRIASGRLGDKINSSGQVPPKVIKRLLEDGGFCDDAMAAEYFGGIFASSRSEIPRDDRAASMLSLLDRLSVYQIRLHYIVYSLIRRTYLDQKLTSNLFLKITGRAIQVPFNELVDSMNFSASEDKLWIISHAVTGLLKEDLTGELDHIPMMDRRKVATKAFTFIPTLVGVELYLWAHGMPDFGVNRWLRSDLKLPDVVDLELPPTCEPINLEEPLAVDIAE